MVFRLGVFWTGLAIALSGVGFGLEGAVVDVALSAAAEGAGDLDSATLSLFFLGQQTHRLTP